MTTIYEVYVPHEKEEKNNYVVNVRDFETLGDG